jgi:hypothetical protein
MGGCFRFSNHFFPSFVAEAASIAIEMRQSPIVLNNAIQSIFHPVNMSCKERANGSFYPMRDETTPLWRIQLQATQNA